MQLVIRIARQRGMWTVVLALLLAAATLQDAHAQGTKKLPVPSKKSQDELMALILELYQPAMKKAEGKAVALATLGSQFLQEARDTNDNSTGRYLLLVLAADYAAKGGNAPVALQAIEEKAQRFQIDPDEVLRAKIDALFTASKSNSGKEDHQTVLDSSLVLLEEALSNDDYTSGMKLVRAAEFAAIKLRSVPLLSAIRRRAQDVLRLQKAFAHWKPFADRLAKNPKDPEANYEMGVYQAFFKGNWERGLPLLARGSNAAVRNLANADMKEPENAAAQVDLGDMWAKEADALKNPLRTQVLLRAYHWYQQALGDITPKKRADVERKMTAVMDQVPAEFRIGEIAVEIRRCELPWGPVYSAEFSPDGKKLISGGADGALHLWDVRTGKDLRRLDGHSGRIWTVAFHPDGRSVLSGGFDNTVRLWDLVSGREMRRFEGHTDYVRDVQFSRHGNYVLSGGDDRLGRLWDTESTREIQAFRGHNHFVWGVALSRDGTRALTGSLDKTLRLWDVKTGKTIRILKGHKDTVLSVAMSPDGRRALSGSTDKTIILWDLETGQPMHTFEGHDGYVQSVAFSPDGRRALSGGADNTVRLWDLYEGKHIRTLTGHTDQVWHVAFSPDGRYALSCGQDGTIRIWGSAK